MTIRSIRAAAAAIALIALGILVHPHAVTAFNPQPDPPAFGMFGITHEQTARINLVAPGTAGLVAPGPCRQVELRFVDGEGATLAWSQETLVPGHAVSLDLNGGQLLRETGRAEVRAEIRTARGCTAGLVPSVEVFDNLNGRTAFVLPAVQ